MNSHSSRRPTLCMLATALLCVACLGQVSRSTPPVLSGDGRFFFGRSSQDVNHCPTAWLLYIGKGRGNAGLFVVASMKKFSKVEVDSDGKTLFEWSALGEDFRLNGTLRAGKIKGSIQRVDRRSGLAQYLCSIAATELPPQPALANPSLGVAPARYSNTGYSNEGGDLTGVDIRFFSTKQGTRGMITFYESYWFEPTNRPLVISQIEADTERIRFAVEAPDGVGHYHLIRTPGGALFGRDDVAPEDRGQDVSLKREVDVVPPVDW